MPSKKKTSEKDIILGGTHVAKAEKIAVDFNLSYLERVTKAYAILHKVDDTWTKREVQKFVSEAAKDAKAEMKKASTKKSTKKGSSKKKASAKKGSTKKSTKKGSSKKKVTRKKATQANKMNSDYDQWTTDYEKHFDKAMNIAHNASMTYRQRVSKVYAELQKADDNITLSEVRDIVLKEAKHAKPSTKKATKKASTKKSTKKGSTKKSTKKGSTKKSTKKGSTKKATKKGSTKKSSKKASTKISWTKLWTDRNGKTHAMAWNSVNGKLHTKKARQLAKDMTKTQKERITAIRDEIQKFDKHFTLEKAGHFMALVDM